MTDCKVTLQPHYADLSPQPRTVIWRWGLSSDHHRACALKYIARAGKKGDFDKDIAKAADYLLWRLMEAGATSLLNDLAEAAQRYAQMIDE